MKLRRIAAIASACIIVTSAFIGIIGVGTASAASYTHLCAWENQGQTEKYCAYAESPVAMYSPEATGSSTTNWVYPNSEYDTGQIQQADTDECMTIASNDNIVMAKCESGNYSQQWLNTYDDYYDGTVFTSLLNETLCLSYDEAGKILRADNCSPTASWYQVFYS
jgi:hypothetical protein